MTDSGPPPLRALFAERDYMAYWFSRWTAGFGGQVRGVVMGWQVYEISRRTEDVAHSAFNVSMLGLVTFLPMLALTLPAGEIVDRHDRRKVLQACYTIDLLTALALAAASFLSIISVPLLLAIAAVMGAVRAFWGPAQNALGPMLVPRALLPSAIAFNSLAWQSASIVGPTAAGFLLAGSPSLAYGTGLAMAAAAVACLLLVQREAKMPPPDGTRLALMREGLAYVWRQKVVFGSISLDMVAVLLGGVTALLPAFARDVLHTGPDGFGVLRAGTAIGGTLAGLYIANRPINSRAGVAILGGVALFGLFTIVVALSQSLWISVIALAGLGAADMVSVYVRQTLVQMVTPDHMRGRVAAVSGLFISASNELGEFESGLAARFLGVVGSALFGGVGAVAATGVWGFLFPDLRRADRLE